MKKIRAELGEFEVKYGDQYLSEAFLSSLDRKLERRARVNLDNGAIYEG